jgi:hypothetical protein
MMAAPAANKTPPGRETSSWQKSLFKRLSIKSEAPAMANEPDNIEVTPDMIAAGFKMLIDSGVLDLDYDTGREPTIGALLPYGRPRWAGNEQVVVDIYRAMVRARSGHVAVEVTSSS